MHASIRRYKLDPNITQSLVVKVEDGFVPIVSKLPGFVSYMVIDSGDGTVATVSVFENEEAANQSTDAARHWVQENLSEFVHDAPDITAGEIVIAAPTPPAW